MGKLLNQAESQRLQAEKMEKLRQWQEIQTKAPEIALAMKVISERMGKFASVKIKFFERISNH